MRCRRDFDIALGGSESSGSPCGFWKRQMLPSAFRGRQGYTLTMNVIRVPHPQAQRNSDWADIE